VFVEINLSVIPLAVGGLETGLQDVAVVNVDVLGGVVESHFEEWMVGCVGMLKLIEVGAETSGRNWSK
jgi:hypothetical protein